MQTGEICVDWQSCVIYENLNLKKVLWSVLWYGHSCRKSTNSQMFGYCAENQETQNCIQKQNLKCPNCAETIATNLKLKETGDVQQMFMKNKSLLRAGKAF